MMHDLPTDHLRWHLIDPELLHQAEEAECANDVLDDLGVPRVDRSCGRTYSLVGRIRWALANRPIGTAQTGRPDA